MKQLFLLMVFAIILTGCQPQQAVQTQGITPEANPTAKQGNTTLSGKVVKSGASFSLVDLTGKQTEIDSYNIDLAVFENKQVSITGQFSGDTLFAAKVEEQK